MLCFDYKCECCDTIVEIRVKSSDRDAIQWCKDCNSELVKLFSAPAFHLVGSGWYRDGYR